MLITKTASPSGGAKILAASASTAAFLVLGLAPLAEATPLPHGRAGECFEQVRVKPPLKTVEERVHRPPLITYKTTPAVYTEVSKQVLVRPAVTTYETRPAVYKTVTVWKSRPGPVRTIVVPAVYETVYDKTLIEPEHLEWRRGRAAGGFSSEGAPGAQEVTPTGEVLCRILVPARYASVRRRVLVQPERRRDVQGPPRRILCYERVLVTPAERIPHTAPAVYKTVMVRKLVTPAVRTRVVTPQPDRVVQRRVPEGRGRLEWRQIHCRTPAPVRRPPRTGGERG